MSEDPLGFAAGDANMVRYVGNAPTNAVDPSGLEGLIEKIRKKNDLLNELGRPGQTFLRNSFRQKELDDQWLGYDSIADLLKAFRARAAGKGLPTRLFDELLAADVPLTICKGDDPQYVKSVIYLRDTDPSNYARTDFDNLYNEMFQAWWEHVFMKSPKYSDLRSRLFTDARLERYGRAISFRGRLAGFDARIALEEAWSENVSHLIASVNLQQDIGVADIDYKAVRPVGHSYDARFTSDADHVFPDREEFGWIQDILVK